MLGHIYAGARVNKLLAIHSVSINSVIPVLTGDRAFADRLWTAVTYIGGFIKTITSFPDKVSTMLIACSTGGTLNAAKDDLVTYVSLLTSVTMNAEVMSIVKRSFSIKIACSVQLDLLRDCGRILA